MVLSIQAAPSSNLFIFGGFSLVDNHFNYSQIPSAVGHLSRLTYLNLSSSSFAGQIPLEISQLNKLVSLELSLNPLLKLHKPGLASLVQNLTDLKELCLSYVNVSSPSNNVDYSANFQQAFLSYQTYRCFVFDRYNQELTGYLPEFHGSRPLVVLKLAGTSFSGELPNSISNLNSLNEMDISEYNFSWSIPSSIGTLSELKVLILRFNKFHGAIRHLESSFSFPTLRFIDLSHNGFKGELPSNFFRTWRSMMAVDNNQSYLRASQELVSKFGWLENYNYSITITNKGVQTIYLKILNVLTVIALSSNQFRGKISESIGILKGLHVLNLSNNNRVGYIPPSSLGNLTQLELLDLLKPSSQERYLGPIPRGRQFDTFPNSSYEVNSGLCGDPLSKKCGELEASPLPPPSKFKQGDEHSWFPVDRSDWLVVCMGYGGGL
ncbi:receptor-like protein 37 [Cornus florida]|uniref:receptor-like protein 37 n=1 Tax=Cornus florida TaxID=4283 RepID=UPI00289C2F2B|nr:receptor-like protein 37 [Cornus florida]